MAQGQKPKTANISQKPEQEPLPADAPGGIEA